MKIIKLLLLLSCIALSSHAHTISHRDSLQYELETIILACDTTSFKKQLSMLPHLITAPEECTEVKQELLAHAQSVKAYKLLKQQTLNTKYIQNRSLAYRSCMWAFFSLLSSGCLAGALLAATGDTPTFSDTAGVIILAPLAALSIYKTIHNGRKALYYADVLTQEIEALDEIIKLINQ